MIMLICYSMISFFFYLLIPAVLHRALWYSPVALQTFTALSVSTEAIQRWPLINVVLATYLPNEQDIIRRQARYALRELNYAPYRMTINVCYNTPCPIEPVETELRNLAKERSSLRILKVPKSTSKADNLNHFLTLESKGEIITLYDTDHYPEPDALRWVAKRFMQGGVDIIQGRCCIYNYSDTFMTRLIASESDLIYGVMHSCRAEIQDYGFFGGSNGHWNASLLRTLGMQKHMLTEDIDSYMRAIISGARFEYNLKVLSYELAPETPLCSCQASRGAYSEGNKWRSCIGLFQLLLYREFYFYINSQLVFMLAFGICYNLPTQGLKRYFEDFGGYSMGGIFLFAMCTTIWYSVTSMMAIFCHSREFIKFEKWNPTARTSANSKTNTSTANSRVRSNTNSIIR
ncbi:hypothetical protein NDA11_004574 [Ustilago hordei]|nr:hypothetical protein NDA11_004574 [Ustilago hordei]